MEKEALTQALLKRLISLDYYQSIREHCPLVGGQSLFLWFLSYKDQIKDPDGNFYRAAQSSDIDFLADPEVSITLSKELSASLQSDNSLSQYIDKIEIHKASPFEQTPNTVAILIYTKRSPTESPIIIDFISNLKGLTAKDLKEFSTQSIDGELFTILTPPQILKSRLNNLYGLPYGEQRKAAEVIRVQVASKIVSAFIADLSKDDVKAARSYYQDMYELAGSELGVRYHSDHDFDMTSVLADPLSLGLGSDFSEKQLPRLKAMVAKKREANNNRIANSSSQR